SLLASYRMLATEYGNIDDRFTSVFTESRIYSEIEGSLNVESVPTTRRRLKELLEENAPVGSTNDVIIKNMKAGIDFVTTRPVFNEENLFRLYSILSRDCLDEDNKLEPGSHYRFDSVEIAEYHGCQAADISSCMEALFAYVDEVLQSHNENDILLLPHICHYYMLYIHPYFDYNGRTARMVSYWVYLLSESHGFPPIVSEVINQTKRKYYQAIELSRDAHNDLTYFFIYLLNVSIEYVLCYHNLDFLEKKLRNNGMILTETDLNYLKKILMSEEGVFSYMDVLRMANVEMSKQGAFKILNRYTEYGILKEVQTSSRTKYFELDHGEIPYSMKNLDFR
ncbi:MAG: Fic family protein, partial [Erysipelotrichaceae bacterium]|nr:Fic family protein [Erysipelotrichaceae bacterium]